MDSVIRTLKERKTPLTAREVGQLLALSPYTIYDMVQKGTIPFAKLRGALRFDPESLTKWIESSSHSPIVSRGRRS